MSNCTHDHIREGYKADHSWWECLDCGEYGEQYYWDDEE